MSDKKTKLNLLFDKHKNNIIEVKAIEEIIKELEAEKEASNSTTDKDKEGK